MTSLEAPHDQQLLRGQDSPGKCTTFSIRAAASVAGIFCIVCGGLSFITISAFCIVAGLYLIFLGIFIEMLEAPICCQYFMITDKINTWGSNLPAWVKALMYLILPAVALGFCQTLWVIIGAIAVIAIAVMYGMVFIGRKGDGVRAAHTNQQLDNMEQAK